MIKKILPWAMVWTLALHGQRDIRLLGPQEPPLFPQLSPRASVQQVIGTTVLSVTYHRPKVRGRAIWGSLVPYGQVWRTGANEATTISFSEPVKVQGHPVPAGTYALFSIPGPDQWTLILNKRAKQIGAWEYDPKLDLVRFDVKAKPVLHTEWLTYEVYPGNAYTAYVDLYWEKIRVSFLVEVDVDEIVTKRMRKLMASRPNDWKIFAQAAEYCLEQEIHMGEALAWAERSIKIQEDPTNLFVKARLLHHAGKVSEAIQMAEKAIQMAKNRKASAAVLGPMEVTLAQWKKGGVKPPSSQRPK